MEPSQRQEALAHYRQEIPLDRSREHRFESFQHSTHALESTINFHLEQMFLIHAVAG